MLMTTIDTLVLSIPFVVKLLEETVCLPDRITMCHVTTINPDKANINIHVYSMDIYWTTNRSVIRMMAQNVY